MLTRSFIFCLLILQSDDARKATIAVIIVAVAAGKPLILRAA